MPTSTPSNSSSHLSKFGLLDDALPAFKGRYVFSGEIEPLTFAARD
jgi:hypothetical protein